MLSWEARSEEKHYTLGKGLNYPNLVPHTKVNNIYTNIPESDGDMSGIFKTHISD